MKHAFLVLSVILLLFFINKTVKYATFDTTSRNTPSLNHATISPNLSSSKAKIPVSPSSSQQTICTVCNNEHLHHHQLAHVKQFVSQNLKEFDLSKREGGSSVIRMPSGFQHVSVAKLDENGNVVIECHTSSNGLDMFFGQN